MIKKKPPKVVWLILIILMAAALSVASGKNNSADTSYVRFVRTIETGYFTVPHPAQLAYIPESALFAYLSILDLQADWGQKSLLMLVSFADESKGTVALVDDLANTFNISYNPLSRSLFLFDDVNQKLIEYSLDADGRPDPVSRQEFDVGHFGMTETEGMTIDSDSGDLFILDGKGKKILKITPSLGNPSGGGTAYQGGELTRISLKSLPKGSLRGLAFNPSNGYLYIVHVSSRKLFGISTCGQVMSERDLKDIPFQDPCGMVFAPSGDRTDDPANTSLYLADSGLPDTRRPGQIIEISLVEPFASASSTLAPLVLDPFQSTLVRTIQTSQLFPPSPDTAGLAYHSSNGRIFYSDSEVNEVDIFTGDNYFEMTSVGSLVDSMSTLGFGSKEPTGLAFNATNGHLFVSDDDRRRIYEVNPGGDGLFDTSDDQVTSIDTTLFDSFDPEGIAFDASTQTLYIADGVNNEVYIVRPGSNGEFDGIPPAGDDQVRQFDTAGFGMVDPEGIEFDDANRHLYLVGHGSDNLLTEVSRDGTLLREINVSAAKALALSGLARAPSSYNSQIFSIYICDCGVDNGADPDENDGKIYEMTLPQSDSDGEPPMVTTFDLPSTSSSLTVPILTFTATDNVGVTGYLATESSSTLSAGASGWTTTAPTSYSFTSKGTKTLYGWARDAAGNVSAALSDTVTISTGSGGPQVVDTRISSRGDDAEESPRGNINLTSSDLELGTDSGREQTVGMRFVNLGIPQGATILEAYIQFTVDEADSGATTVVIRGEAADNAAEFSKSRFGLTTRTQTAAAVPWNPAPWTVVGAAGPDQRTPNIAPLIQEIVNRPGWAQGNAMVLLVAGTGERTAESYNVNPQGAPLLHVVYNSGGGGSDSTPPVVTAFDLPATSDSLTVPILSFSATDENGVTGYLAKESSATPAADDPSWSGTPPTEHTFTSEGSQTLYGWAKDAAGNVSSSLNDTVVITLADTTPPTVTAFDLPATSSSLTVPILTFIATDDTAVTGYLLSESANVPTVDDPNWTGAVPATYTFAADGTHTLFAWAKDAAGNISASLSDTVEITIPGGNTIQVPGDQPTIQAGINAAGNGDIVLIAPGTYSENLILDGKTIALASLFYTTGQSEYIDQTVINGGGGTVLTVGSSSNESHIVGLTIQNGEDGISVHGSSIHIQHNRIIGNIDGVDYEGGGGTCENNLFANNSDDGIDVDGSIAVSIIQNTIRDNGDDGIEIRLHAFSGPTLNINIRQNLISGNQEDGIQLIDYPDLSDRVFRIERNVIVGNQMVGIGFMPDGNTIEDFSGAPIPERVYLINNTIVGNFYGVTGGANVVALNNILADTTNSALKNVTGDSIVSYVLLWNNGTDSENSIVDSDSTLFANPLFNQNYTLTEASPAIDAGTAFFQWQGETVLDMPPSSYSGNAPDLGAYESSFSADTQPPTVTAFDLPATSDSLTVPILTFTATDDTGATGYLTTESSATPAADDPGWSATPPTEHTFSAEGSQTLYGWAKDAAGNVSSSMSDIVVISTGSGEQVIIDNRISSDNDDAEETPSGNIDLTSSDLELGTDGGRSNAIGMRFANLNIPQGVTIVDAYIQFTVDEADSGATTVVIRGEAADNAAAFTSTLNNITARPQTSASVSWNPAPWTTIGTAGPDQRTPGIAMLIQEIVSRPGWAPGNALVILVTGTGERTAESFNGSIPDAPLLHVVFE